MIQRPIAHCSPELRWAVLHSGKLDVNTAKTLAIFRNDIHRALTSARGILFLVFFGIFWFWVLGNLLDGDAATLADPEDNRNIATVLSWLGLERDYLRLFLEYPPTLVAFFYVALTSMPLFALWVASDQTAGDIDSKFIRFLTPRAGRIEIYLGRFAGTAIFFCLCLALISAAALLTSLLIDPESDRGAFMFTAEILPLLCIYALPFVALMSLLTAVIGSSGIAGLVGIGGYAIFLAMTSFLVLVYPEVELISYLAPSAFKGALLSFDRGLAGAIGGLFIQSAVYLAIGLVVFQRRDI